MDGLACRVCGLNHRWCEHLKGGACHAARERVGRRKQLAFHLLQQDAVDAVPTDAERHQAGTEAGERRDRPLQRVDLVDRHTGPGEDDEPDGSPDEADRPGDRDGGQQDEEHDGVGHRDLVVIEDAEDRDEDDEGEHEQRP